MPIRACHSSDAAAKRAAFERYLRTGRRPAPLEFKFNPYHDSETGQFTTAEGAGVPSDAVDEAQLTSGAILREAGKLAGIAFAPADVGSVMVDTIVGAPVASDMLPPDVLIAENNNRSGPRSADCRRKSTNIA